MTSVEQYTIYIEEEPREVELFAFGAYGDIFKTPNNEFAIKIFKRRESGQYENFIAENTFRSEVGAYERLMEADDLKRYIPRFYGAIKIDRIVIDDNDVSNKYWCDFAYEIEYINHKFKKIGLSSEVKKFIEPFRQIGINYLEDADYSYYDGQYKFIDFGILGVREELEDNFLWVKPEDFDRLKNQFYERHPSLDPNINRG